MELKAEIARQEAKVLASERSRSEAIHQIESIAYQEFESMTERIMHRDQLIRRQEEMLQGQGETIQQMTLEDEGATYRCMELERMSQMSQEVAAHLKNRVMSINEEFNAQGRSAEFMYNEADADIRQLRRSLDVANHRYTIARSELEASSNAYDEMAKQHATEIFDKGVERQNIIRESYEREATGRGAVLDLQQKYMHEERELQAEMRRIYATRNEVHDVHLEMNELAEQKRSLETQVVRHQTFRDEMAARGNALSIDDARNGNPELAEELVSSSRGNRRERWATLGKQEDPSDVSRRRDNAIWSSLSWRNLQGNGQMHDATV